ncbi:hypothetical protein IJ556_03050, partial [bacterium]|nr:hypothetical protein [bacterium]
SPKSGGLDGAAMSRFQNIIEVPLPNNNALYEALKMRIQEFISGKEFIGANDKNLQILAKKMEDEKYSFRDLDNLVNTSRNYLLNDLAKNKEAKYKIEHLQNAFENHGLTDGTISGNAKPHGA